MIGGRAQPPVRIGRAGIEQAEGVAQLHGRLFERPWTASSIRQLLEHAGSLAFVVHADDSAEVIGFIIGRVVVDEAELLTLGVHDAWQGRGLGRLLLEALCKAARQAQARRLYLEVAAGNVPALRLYERVGAREVGRRKGYYERAGAPPDDAINLAVAL